jgi:tetratricopeptide (TPR) repeat protein
MEMKLMGRMLAVACVAVLVSVGSWAQLSKGFKGRVLDRDGKPVADCPVIFEDLSNQQNHYETKTAANGTYIYTGVPFSDKGYTIKVKIPNHPELPEVSKVDKPKIMEFTEVDFDMRKDLVMKGGEAKPSPAAEAKKLYDMNDYEGALSKAQEAMSETDPNSLKVASLIKASCLQNLGRNDEAITAYEGFNTTYPGNVDVIGNLAKLYDQKGDKAKADAYKKEFQAKGGKVLGETYNKGVEALNSGDAAKASGLFEQALKEDPNDADAHKNWAVALAQLNKPAQAIEQLQIYLKLRPNAEDAETWKAAISGLQAMIDQQKAEENKKKR